MSEYKEDLGDDLYSALKEHIIPASDLDLGETLGEGFFGVVKKVNHKSRNIILAAKFLRGRCSDHEVRLFMQEAKIMAKYSHPNILQLTGITKHDGKYAMLSPYMENGQLNIYLEENEDELPLWKLTWFGLQAAEGMLYLEGQKVIHRDLAARNCLLDGSLHLKVSDYGLSRQLYEKYYYDSDEKKVPYKWLAPECLTLGKYTTKSDVWAFAVLLWEIFTCGGIPYAAVQNNKLIEYIVEDKKRLRIPSMLQEEEAEYLYEIMQKCWAEKPANRPKFKELQAELQSALNKQCPDKSLTLAAGETQTQDQQTTVTEYKQLWLTLAHSFTPQCTPVLGDATDLTLSKKDVFLSGQICPFPSMPFKYYSDMKRFTKDGKFIDMSLCSSITKCNGHLYKGVLYYTLDSEGYIVVSCPSCPSLTICGVTKDAKPDCVWEGGSNIEDLKPSAICHGPGGTILAVNKRDGVKEVLIYDVVWSADRMLISLREERFSVDIEKADHIHYMETSKHGGIVIVSNWYGKTISAYSWKKRSLLWRIADVEAFWDKLTPKGLCSDPQKEYLIVGHESRYGSHLVFIDANTGDILDERSLPRPDKTGKSFKWQQETASLRCIAWSSEQPHLTVLEWNRCQPHVIVSCYNVLEHKPEEDVKQGAATLGPDSDSDVDSYQTFDSNSESD